MPLPQVVKKQTAALNKRFDKCMAQLERLKASGRYDEYDTLREQELGAIYKDACGLVRDAGKVDAPYCNDLLDTVQAIIDEAGDEGDMYFGHPTTQSQGPGSNDKMVVEDREPLFGKSSPFAIFRLNLPKLTATPADCFATTVYDARCEIASVRDIKDHWMGRREDDEMVDLQLSAGGSCLAAIGSVKNRSEYHYPWIACHYPDDPKSRLTDLMKRSAPVAGRFEPGLAGKASHMAMDESHRLILVADENRVKSFVWGPANGPYYRKPCAKHTLDSDGFTGPILVLPNGTILRVGKGSAGVWSIKLLQDHGSKGTSIVGKELMVNKYDREREENPYIEKSSGSAPTSRLAFANKSKLEPEIWQLLPQTPSTVLCAGRSNKGCITMDLEHGGTTTVRFKGHPGYVTHFSTSAADPRIFLTSNSGDGRVRLFDVRHPSSAFVLKVGKRESSGPIALAHPDGITTAFTHGNSSQDFKVWDLRARACMYELGTPDHCDSFTNSLVWDSGRNTLYSWKSMLEDGDPDYSDCSEEYEEISGYNRIYRYTFKEKPRYSMLPYDNPKMDEVTYFEDEYDTEAPLDDSDDDYED